jgi:flavin reductase (DIM6/NTAB) family NADH-FMN oxidoreductase RutF
MADVDFRSLPPRERYKLIVSGVVPRPIALVTSLGTSGQVNAAPFSFFNAVCNDPPALAVAVNHPDEASLKDTARNIKRMGEFVVNMVDEALAPQMNICEVEFAEGVSELAVAGLAHRPSAQIATPWIAEAPIAFECKLANTVQIAPGKYLFIGIAVHMHIRDDLYDADRNYIHAERARLVARMHGAGGYARTSDLFDMPRLSPEEKLARFGDRFALREP